MRCKTILLLALSAWGIMACQNYTDKIAVEIRQPVYPVLTLKEHNPVLCLRLIRNSGVAYQLEKINFTWMELSVPVMSFPLRCSWMRIVGRFVQVPNR